MITLGHSQVEANPPRLYERLVKFALIMMRCFGRKYQWHL
jgi:hypothetical protein